MSAACIQQSSLLEAGRDVLLTADPVEKARASLRVNVNSIEIGPAVAWPEAPALPEKPELVDARTVPKRSVRSERGRIALIHALAHIELNAINLAWDVAGRFASASELNENRDDFVREWAGVAKDEARHFLLLTDYLERLGAAYGDLPAHGGLWDAAHSTSADLLARLAIVPLVHEARGLDVTPTLIASLDDAGDVAGAKILQVIYEDEIGHVRTGFHWFRFVCEARALEPVATFQQLVRTHHRGMLKRPFNRDARDRAGLSSQFYEALTE
jgi:uncharacterized ferritin-like protein (DUF455 family)